MSIVSVSWTNYNIWFAIISPSSVCFNERLSAGHLCYSVTIYQELPRISSVFLLPTHVRCRSCNSQICPHYTPHLMTSCVRLCVYTGTVQWHVVISDNAAPAAAEARVTMAGCCSPVICYLQMRSIQFTIYTTASTPHHITSA